jgi:sulfopyruvate decarboxylase subunit alpha
MANPTGEATAGIKADLRGSLIIDALAKAKIDHAIAVPDIVTARGVLTPLAKDPRFKLIRVCKEDECIGISAALAVCGRRAVNLFQNTGFLDSINAITHIAVHYDLPIIMVIGLLAHTAGTIPRDSQRVAIRVVEPMLESLGVESILVDRDADTDEIAPRIDAAYAASKPLAILIGRRPVP